MRLVIRLFEITRREDSTPWEGTFPFLSGLIYYVCAVCWVRCPGGSSGISATRPSDRAGRPGCGEGLLILIHLGFGNNTGNAEWGLGEGKALMECEVEPLQMLLILLSL